MEPNEYEKVRTEDMEEAEKHVEWFLSMVKPLLISFFVHGKKHGRSDNQQLE